jgi:hypothetical protein
MPGTGVPFLTRGDQKVSDIFDEFIKKQNESAGVEKKGLSIEQEKSMWLGKINELYALVEDSLSEYICTGLAQFAKNDISITEELIGKYAVQEALINLGRQVIKLTPVGTFLIGARGRVDMKGPMGNVRFVIVPPDSTGPRIRITIGDSEVPADPIIPPETWAWKIATPPPRVTYIDLTKESFREALMGVVNG